MATRTSVGSGLWSVAGTWDTGVPADDDVVVIAAGHTVEFDVDTSGFATGIAGITITGTLKFTRTPGTYYLKMKAATYIGGAGTFDCGTSALDAIPFTAKHTITGGNGWYIKGNDGVGLTMTVYAAEPVNKIIYLSGVEAVGQTVLSVDTNVTGDIWAAGDTIRINDKNVYDSEERKIAVGGIGASEITVTSGLSAQKEEGASVVLCTRNVTFIANGSDILKFFQSGKLTIAGGHLTASGRTIVNSPCTLSGGVLNNASYGQTGDATITGGVITGCSYALGAGKKYISGGIFTGNNHGTSTSGDIAVTGGLFVCNNNCFYTSNIISILGGTFSKNNKLCERCTGVVVRNIATVSHSYDMNWTQFNACNVLFSSASESTFYTSFSQFAYSESLDHDQVSGAFKAWTTGGVTTKQAVTKPTGYSNAMQTVLENATVPGYWQKEITIGAGASVNIEMNLRKDAAMAYLPRIIVFNKASVDPLAGGTGLKTFTMTDSIDTWEDDLYTYTNSGTEDVTLVIRCQGMNATGNMYSALYIEQINVDLTNAIALITAVKAQTDQLAFTVANQVDANALSGGTTPADVADAVWDEAIADHVVATSFGAKNQKVVPSESVNDYKADVSGLATTLHVQEVEDKIDNLDGDVADVFDDVGDVKTVVDAILIDTATDIPAILTAIKGVDWTNETLKSIKDAIDALPAGISTADIMSTVVEGAFTLQDVLKIMAGALAGKLDGGGTGTLTFRDLSDTLDRIIATVDLSNGDRDDITLDLT